MSMRVLVLCSDGVYQRELVRRTANAFNLVGVVWYRPVSPKGSFIQRLLRYRDPVVLARYLEVRVFLPRYVHAADALRQSLFPDNDVFADVPEVSVPDINSPETVAFIASQRPDIVLVNGTNLLRKPVLRCIPKIPLGIVNLHTGLSPYSRGGNCNLFMLLEKHPEFVGITVHHINQGIDSGDIILSSQVPMAADDNYEMVDLKTFDTGIDALLSGARLLSNGRAARVSQWEPGKLFLRRTGYSYDPYKRLLANRLLESGLVSDYLSNKVERDVGVRVIGEIT